MDKYFIKDLIITAIVIGVVIFAVNQAARLGLYLHKVDNERISQCVANGYTWGDCYRVIVDGSGQLPTK